MKKGILMVLKILVLILFIAWILIVFIDYFKTRNEEMPVFCIKETTYDYDDGSTYECIGLGYKMYKYERESINATEFGPFFIKQRTNMNGIKK